MIEEIVRRFQSEINLLADELGFTPGAIKVRLENVTDIGNLRCNFSTDATDMQNAVNKEVDFIQSYLKDQISKAPAGANIVIDIDDNNPANAFPVACAAIDELNEKSIESRIATPPN